MTKVERANFILEELERRFPETPIPLDHKDAYTLLIAVLLSAQCTDVRVNQVTPHLYKLADTPEKMVKLSVDVIESIVRPCGLGPRKAKAIWELSHILISEYGGKVPESMDALEKLPGVGHKTASVVMAQAFGHDAFPVDTHIHRLAQRWELTSGKSVVHTEQDLKKLFPKNTWSKLHLQIIFYGREVCPAKKCDGLSCPICQKCFPRRKQSKDYQRA